MNTVVYFLIPIVIVFMVWFCYKMWVNDEATLLAASERERRLQEDLAVRRRRAQARGIPLENDYEKVETYFPDDRLMHEMDEKFS